MPPSLRVSNLIARSFDPAEALKMAEGYGLRHLDKEAAIRTVHPNEELPQQVLPD